MSFQQAPPGLDYNAASNILKKLDKAKSEKTYLYLFEEGCTGLPDENLQIKILITAEEITSENVRKFAGRAGGKYCEHTRFGTRKEMNSGKLWMKGEKHYSIIELIGEPTKKELRVLKKYNFLNLSYLELDNLK